MIDIPKVPVTKQAAEPRLYRLAECLARPVAHGWLTMDDACAAIWVNTLRAERRGELEHDAGDVGRMAEHILGEHVRNLEARREEAIGAIRIRIIPLLRMHVPRNRILAEAYNVNALYGNHLDEAEVYELARVTAWECAHGVEGGRGR